MRTAVASGVPKLDKKNFNDFIGFKYTVTVLNVCVHKFGAGITVTPPHSGPEQH